MTVIVCLGQGQRVHIELSPTHKHTNGIPQCFVLFYSHKNPE